MRRIKAVVFLIFILTVTQLGNCSETSFEIKTPDYEFTFDGEPISDCPFISIHNEYYVPVEAMAEFFGFHTEIDKKNADVIQLVTGNSEDVEEKISKLYEFVKNTNRKAKASKAQIIYNENKMQTALMEVDGCYFVKATDAVQFFGIYILRDDEHKVIDFTTDAFKCISQEEQEVYKNYVSKNALPIDLNKLEDQSLLKSSGLDQYQIMLFGEQHAVAGNFESELFLIKYLNQNEGIRHIVIENGYCDAQLLNRYLETGDNSILENMMANLKGTYAYSENMYQFYQDIYAYNKLLPKDKKLQLIGVDIQHQTSTGMKYLLSLLPQKEMPKVIQKDIVLLRLMEEKKAYTLEKLKRILESVENNETVYKAYLDEAYECFKFGLMNVVQGLECYSLNSDQAFMSLREKKMIENFIRQYDQLDHAKCFGSFGGQHTNLNADESTCNLATYINTQYKETKGKVGSICARYYNCQGMDCTTGESMPIQYQSSSFEKMLAEASKGNYVLIPLCKKDSIFIEDGSSQSQQYLLLVKDSPAATIYQSNIKQ